MSFTKKHRLYGVVAACALLLGIVVHSYLSLQSARHIVGISRDILETRYQRRMDNLQSTVTALGSQTSTAEFADIAAEIRQSIQDWRSAETAADRLSAGQHYEEAAVKLLRYGQQSSLATLSEFSVFAKQLPTVQDRSAASWDDYQEAIQDYNMLRSRLPYSLLAGVLGYDGITVPVLDRSFLLNEVYSE